MNLEKLSCRARVALLCDYLDGGLPPSARRVVAAHRRSCLPCGRVLKSLERTLKALRGLKTSPAAPPSARRSLRAALQRARRPSYTPRMCYHVSAG
ncbi:MAG: hypothetical protein KGL74_14850 [Elusimicrobia bacterium]|nr:hypothetical protein [Elusimicrobiota bacterium]MDE2512402.1 hypothetical protein [Elusimicrobiota bacterium]